MAVQNVLTDAGRALLSSSLQQTEAVVFAFARVGTGSAASQGTTLASLTALVTPYTGHDAIIARKQISTDGTLVVSVQFNNNGVTSALNVREVGVYARLSSQTDSAAILFSYMDLGDYTDLVLPESSATVQRVYDIPYAFNGASGVTVNISPAGMITNADTLTAAQPASSANAGKVVRLNSDGKLPVDITGDAATLGGQLPSYYAAAVHDHDDATATKHGYLSVTDKARLDTLNSRVNQDLRTTATPTFGGLVVNGYIDGAMFR